MNQRSGSRDLGGRETSHHVPAAPTAVANKTAAKRIRGFLGTMIDPFYRR
jgi:hypothetical protein